MSVWEDIKNRLSVEDVIADYIPVRNAGGNYKAVCPFHQENTPSLMISPSKGIWHCFGCGAGGDIFAFVSQIENISKQESLTILAKKSGIQLERYSQVKTGDKAGTHLPPSEEDYINKGYQLLEWVATLYHNLLLKTLQNHTHPVTIYCRKRKLSEEIIRKFKIGLAPSTNIILEYTQKQLINQQLCLDIGVLKQSPNSKLSDKFKSRLIIPIKSVEGRVVGFTGRVFPGDTLDRPKYLNSSQSKWFNKSQVWFGLDDAKSSIRLKKNAIIVEGNMDVITCHQAGLTQAIASQGTSFTTEQLLLLKKHTTSVLLGFDNDTAGIIASKKFFIEATKVSLEVSSLVIPPEFKDIDEYISAYLNSSKTSPLSLNVGSFFQWYVNSHLSQLTNTNITIQRKALDSVFECIAVMDTIAQEQCLRYITSVTHLSFTTLKTFFDQKYNSHPKVYKNNQTIQSKIATPLETVQADKFQSLIHVWKNFVSLHLTNKDYEQAILKSYQILQIITSDSLDSSSFEDFVSQNKSELEYISQELTTIDNAREHFSKQLLIELDRYIYIISLQEEAMNNYLYIKSVVETQQT